MMYSALPVRDSCLLDGWPASACDQKIAPPGHLQAPNHALIDRIKYSLLSDLLHDRLAHNLIPTAVAQRETKQRHNARRMIIRHTVSGAC
jgi:hypothetical protein